MAKYRKKPVVVDAEQWFPQKPVDGVEYPPLPGTPQGQEYIKTYGPCGIVRRLGNMVAMPGYWIITDANGNKSICDPDTFEETYELVDTE